MQTAFLQSFITNSSFIPHFKYSKKSMQSGFLKLSKQALIGYLISFLVFSSVAGLFLFNPWGTKSADAAWFNDDWNYRKRIDVTITSSAADIVGLDTLLTVDTTGITANLQTNCEDLRFTDINGNILPHYLASCTDNSATNKVWVKANLVPKDTTAYTLYMYYGNATVTSTSNATVFRLYNGLVDYLTLNDNTGTSPVDSSVNGNTATFGATTAAPTWISGGQFSNAVSFDGADYIDVASPDLPTGDFTYAAWVYLDDSNGGLVFSVEDDSGDDDEFHFSISSNELVELRSNNALRLTGTTTISTGTWTHVALTRSGSTVTAYVNGVAGGTATYGTTLSFANCRLYIGIDPQTTCDDTTGVSTVFGGGLNGNIDDPRVYSRALSAEELLAVVNNPGTITTSPVGTSKPTTSFSSEEKGVIPSVYLKFDETSGTTAQDSSGNNNDGTMTSGVSWSNASLCVSNGCAYIDGVVSSPANPVYEQGVASTSVPDINAATTGTLAGTPVEGNLLVAIIYARDGQSRTVDWTADGFTQIYSITGGDNDMFYAGYRIAGASEPTSRAFDFVGDASYTQKVLYFEVSGADTLAPFDTTVSSEYEGFVSSYTTNGQTTVTDNALHIIGYMSHAGASTTPPGTYTEQLESNGYWMADKTITTAGATGTFSISNASGSLWLMSFEMSIRPIGAGGSHVSLANTISGAQTVSMWVKPNVLSGTNPLVDLNGTAMIEADSSGVVTAPGFTSPTVYVNGKTGGTLTANQWNFITVTTGTDVSASAIRIGTDGVYGLKGFVDEFKIYDSALSASQVLANYNARSNPEGSAANLGSSLDNNSALINGLAGYWKMDESSGAPVDSSGNTLTLTNNSSTSFATGKYGNAGSFVAASTDYFSIGSTISGVKTVAFWTYNASTTDEYINLTASAYITSSSGTVSATGFTSPTIYVDGVVNGTLSASNWHHVVVTSDTGINANAFEIGRANSTYNNGKTDEVRLYNRNLSPTEVSALYNWAAGPKLHLKFDEKTGQSPLDTSGNGYITTLGTNSGVASDDPTWINGKYDGGLTFDGSNDYVRLAETSARIENLLAPDGNGTIEAWLKPLGTAASAGSRQELPTAVAGGWGDIGISRGSVSGQDRIWAFMWTTGDCTEHSIGATYTLNEWVHISLVKNGSTMYMYKNGSLVGSSNAGAGTICGSAHETRIGGTDWGSNNWNGGIDDVRIYNYPRTAAQVVSDMNAGHPAPGSPIGTPVGHWKFDEGYGTTANNNGNAGSLLPATLTNMDSPAGATSGWTNSGKFNKALNFNGSSSSGDYLNIPHNAALDITTDITMTAWIKKAADNDYGGIMAKTNATLYDYDFFICDSGCTNGADYLAFYSDSTTPDEAFSNRTITGTNWHHVAVSRIGSTITFYIDGVAAGSTTVTGSFAANTIPLRIGTDGDGSSVSQFNGTIDEPKLYNQGLTADQIKVEMNRGASQVMGAISTNTSNQPNSAANEYCVPGDATSCAGPVAEWKLDEKTSTSAFDSSGNNNTGTLGSTTALPIWTNGKYNAALSFDGNDTVSVSDSTSLSLTGAFTLSAWIKPSNVSGLKTIISKEGVGQNGYFLYLNGANVYAGYGSGAFFNSQTTSTSPIVANRWSHVEVTWDTATIRTYVNGILIQSTNDSDTLADNSTILGIGSNVGGTDYFTGLIDEPKVYNYARTSAQVAWDFNKGGPIAHWKMDECQGTTINDMSGNGFTGTLANATPGTCTTSGSWFDGVAGKINYSLSFDGSDDTVSMGAPAGLKLADAVGISMWVKPDSNALSSGEHAMIHNYDGGGTTAQYELAFISGVLEFNYGNASSYVSYVPNPAITFTAGNWYHITFTDTGSNGTGTFYVNGVEYAATKTGSVAKPIAGNGNTVLGGGTYSGLLDDVRVFNYTLTDSQALSIYNNGSTRYGPVTGAP